MTRAVVADDSHFMRSVISDILDDGGIEVVAQARNGREAVEAVAEHRPDVVTMDVEMPEMNGIEAVERIMADQPTPVLMLSAHTDENADVTFQALDKGAVDFFTKPGGEVSMEMSRLEDQLVDMVSSVAEADPGTADSPQTGGSATGEPGSSATGSESPSADRSTQAGGRSEGSYAENPTLLIGSSTGGPKMVEQVMAQLPTEADFRVLIVQHMPDGFTGRFADRIDSRSDYAVREAQDGERIGGGEALVAPGGKHMVVSNYHAGRLRVKLTEDPPVNSVRPAVDMTMSSAAEVIDDPLIGVILTGMGEDGAAGIKSVKAVGGRTIAQDEETSAVFGMPKRAIETGYVDEVYPIGEVPDGILDALERSELTGTR
jgi:two-component system chemotaxis response regulator CheB